MNSCGVMELDDLTLDALEQNARNATAISPGVTVIRCEPEAVLEMVSELRRLRALEGWVPAKSSLVSAIRHLQAVRTQVQDLENHLGEILLDDGALHRSAGTSLRHVSSSDGLRRK